MLEVRAVETTLVRVIRLSEARPDLTRLTRKKPWTLGSGQTALSTSLNHVPSIFACELDTIAAFLFHLIVCL